MLSRGLAIVSWLVVVAACHQAPTSVNDANASPNAPAKAPAPAPTMPSDTKLVPADWSAFQRDQRPLSGLVPWRGGPRRGAFPFMSVDVARGAAFPHLPGLRGDLRHRVGRKRSRCVRRRARRRARLRSRRAGHADGMIDGAQRRRREEGRCLRAAADGATLVVWEPTRLHVKIGAEPFRTVALKTLPDAPRGFPVHVRAASGRLYLGSSAGEWGGALVSIDLASGASCIEPADTMTTQPS
ncbi:MAG: hypothetical protein U0235_13360 [Polyangiaceae bacterium]